MVQVMVVSRSQMWLRGMKSMLEAEGLEVETGDRLVEGASSSSAVCVVFHLADAEAHTELRAFRGEHKHLPVVAGVTTSDLLTTSRALRAGANAVVGDDDKPEFVAESVRMTVGGRTALPTGVATSMALHVPDTDDARSWINATQIEWLRAMAEGSTVADVAEDVGYSERAMFRQLKLLYGRLGVSNRTEALLWAKQRGLLE